MLRAAVAQQREDEVAGELRWLGETLQMAPELVPLLADPGLALDRKTALVDRTIGRQLGDLLRGMLTLLIRKRRCAALPEIVTAYDRLYHQLKGVAVAHIRVSRATEPALVDRIRRQVEQATGKRLDAEVVVDPSLIGGVSVRVNGTLFDASVKHRLNMLRQRLRHVRVV